MRAPRLLSEAAQGAPAERRLVVLAFVCNFLVLGCYYILRPVRDTVATVGGIGHLQYLFTGTFIGTLLASPAYTALVSRVRLTRLLPGVFGFCLVCVLVFQALFRAAPTSVWIAGSYYVWFSVINLFMLSVFWSLMVDLFSSVQAMRLFPLVAAGGELGAVVGPLSMLLLVARWGIAGLLLLVAAVLALVTLLTVLLTRRGVSRPATEPRPHLASEPRAGLLTEPSMDLAVEPRAGLDRHLGGHALEGFVELFRSRYAFAQGAFVVLMTWSNTVAYYFQTDLIARAFPALAGRAQVIADIDIAVNAVSCVVLLFGVGQLLRRFGLTLALLANPVVMFGSLLALLLLPSVLMIQVIQVVRRVTQYAVTQPSRQICFTVMPQTSRYKTKNVIDTVLYRFGDLSSAWVQDSLVGAGLGLSSGAAAGIGAVLLWGGVAGYLGRRYKKLSALQAAGLS